MRPLYYPRLEYNPHIIRLTNHFGDVVSQPASIPPNTSFVFLCFTNRCGSNYLAELFSSSGKYNLAGEDLNWDTVQDHSNERGFGNFQEYFAFLTSHLRRSGHVFIKAATSHIELLGRAGILDQIANQSEFILIERSDKLSQAISYAIAFATGRFASWMAGSKTPEQIEFSRQNIDEILTSIVDAYRHFDLFFSKNGIVPINIIYEQLVEDRDGHMAFVARRLGLTDFLIIPGKLRLERQSGAVNTAWRARYLSNEE
jgi:LPS sulfotransferase NodH